MSRLEVTGLGQEEGEEEGNGRTLGYFEGPVKGVLLMDRYRIGEGRYKTTTQDFLLEHQDMCWGDTLSCRLAGEASLEGNSPERPAICPQDVPSMQGRGRLEST